ncbi:MAG TPA: hypothetical protein VGC54_00580 [Planctomycetota bacterium]
MKQPLVPLAWCLVVSLALTAGCQLQYGGDESGTDDYALNEADSGSDAVAEPAEVTKPNVSAPAVPRPVAVAPPVLPAVPQDPGSQDSIRAARAASTLQEQKTRVLVDARVDEARQAYADGRLADAENHLLAALQLDAASRDARVLLDEVYVAQGKSVVGPYRGIDDARSLLDARIQRLQAETEASANRGFRQLDAGDISEAIGSLRLAQANIKGTPYQIEWNGLDARVASALTSAEEQQRVAATTRRDDEKRQTFQQLQAQEAASRAQNQQRLDNMTSAAIEAFDQQDYDESFRVSTEILRLDPLNDRAMELRDSSSRARRELVSDRFVKDRRERFRLWLEELEEAKIPYSDILQTPDPDYWASISERRAHYRDLGLSSEEDPEAIALQREVANTRIPGLQVDGETSLEAVIEQLRTYTDIPFVVTPDAIEAVDAEGIEFNLHLVNTISVENALNVIADQAGEGVTYTYRNGVVYITTTAKALGRLVPKAHDVQDLTAQVTDFSGPQIDKIRLPDSTSFGADEEEPPFGGPFGELRPLMNPDNLETLIQQSIAPKTWEDLDGVSIRYQNGFLFVTHTPAVQREVDKFLNDLRRYISSMVTIEARFLTISKDYLQEIGVDFRGLGGTFSPPTSLVNLDDVTSGLEDNTSRGFDNGGDGSGDTNPSAGAFFDEFGDGDIRARSENVLGPYGGRLSTTGGLTMQFVFLDDTQTSLILRAIEKSNRAQELMATTLSAQNTHRAFITVLNQITYVQDMDVEVAQAALIADPQVGVVSDGIVLDVRPTISHDRKYITLELRPTVATLLRPIPEFTSSLAGLTTPVTLQLPELQVSSANTTVVVPDGGTVVIGGLKKLLNIEQRAEVPLLAKIPILSLLFKAEGEANENQDVIILIRAHVTDAREVMENQAR